MREIVESGAIIDAIIVLTIVEGAALLLLWRRTGRGIAPIPMLANLGAGACLLLAFRAATMGAGWMWTAAALLGALVCHLTDFGSRWR